MTALGDIRLTNDRLKTETGRVPNKEISPIRVAMVGCGAIARSYHLPVLAGHEGVRVTALVDRDVKRAGEMARAYGVDAVFDDATHSAPTLLTQPWWRRRRHIIHAVASIWPGAVFTCWSKSRWPLRRRTPERWRTPRIRPASS